MQIGDYRTRKKVTGKIFIADIATPTAFRDWGNVLLHKHEPKRDRAQMVSAQKGFVRVTHEEVSKIEDRWTVKLDEHHDELVAALHLSAPGTTVTQTAAAGSAFSLTGVKQGYSYYVGARGLSVFVVTGKTLNADYTIDLGSGMLTVVAGGGIADDANIAGTFTKPALTLKSYKENTQLFRRVKVQIDEFDQNTEIPRFRHIGIAEIYISDQGENDGQKWNEATLMMLAVDDWTTEAIELV